MLRRYAPFVREGVARPKAGALLPCHIAIFLFPPHTLNKYFH